MKPAGRAAPEAMRAPVEAALSLVLSGEEGGYPLRKALRRASLHPSVKKREIGLSRYPQNALERGA